MRDGVTSHESRVSRPATRDLLAQLSGVDASQPLARKLLVAPDITWGWETIVALARRRRGTVGWEATTLLGIAEDLAFTEIAHRGLRRATDVQLGTLVNRAIAVASAEGTVGSGFAELASGLGFRRAVKDALLTLRAAGVSAEKVQCSVERHSPAWDSASVLLAYEALLSRSVLLDPAGMLQLALERFDDEARFVMAEQTLLAAELAPHGLARTLMDRLIAAGATVLPESVPRHVQAPARTAASELDLFVASSPGNELLEVLRRVVKDGRRWDEVEIVTTDRDTYGIALDALCQREGIPCTLLDGVPLTRTRVGRAAERWLRWMEEGLPARLLREAIEAGDVSADFADYADCAGGPGEIQQQAARPITDQSVKSAKSADPSAAEDESAGYTDYADSPDAEGTEPTATSAQSVKSAKSADPSAHSLDRLAIGWSRRRYEEACQRLRTGHFDRVRRREEEPDDEYAARCQRRLEENARLLPFLEWLLQVTPPVPELGSHRDVMSSCARLAGALGGLLERLPLDSEADRRAASRLRDRLAELAASDDREVHFSLAMAELRDGLSDLRAWTDASPADRPRVSHGGAIHLTDISHGGTTGRPCVFLVGLDADRTGGSRVQDPILPDGVRRLIGAELLPLSTERREERRWQLAAMLARVTGWLTVSLSTADDGAGNTVSPANEVLELFRQQRNDQALGYTRLHESLGEPHCAVPSGAPALDDRGIWLSAIAGGPSDYRDGAALVCSAWPLLGAGLTAAAARDGEELTAWNGLVPAAAGRLDPRRSASPISASSLELLSSCPLAWFYRYGLGIRAPDEMEYDGDQWLGPLERGLLLHTLYETLCREYRERPQELLDEPARARAISMANELLAQYCADVAPPSVAVYESEAREIRASALAFLDGERGNLRDGRTTWKAFELKFPAGSSVRFPAGGGSIPVAGRIDRVDSTRDGKLVVIDYKTGKPDRYEKDKRTGPFKGGRYLQPAIYAVAAQHQLGADVARFEYRFPTLRGENRDVHYHADELAAAAGIVDGLMRYVEQGLFPPTNEAHDCTYCDYAPVCRASTDDHHKTSSPRAEWAGQHAESMDAFREMLARRSRK
jgi:CRISPR/Cas system-associated exonuclease Cas4 (RecB family)